MSTIDFTQYAQAIAAFEKADTLKASASLVRASWLTTDDTAKRIADALPPLGTMGAPRKGSEHKAMVDAIKALFPNDSDDAKKHRVTRLFHLCRVVASPVNEYLPGEETLEEYAVLIDRWATVCDKEDPDKVRRLIDGTYGKRGPKGGPVDNGSESADDEGDTATDDVAPAGKPKADPTALNPVVNNGIRTMISAFESGKITQAEWNTILADLAYSVGLAKAAKAPIQASA